MAMQKDDSVAGVYRNTSEGKKLTNGINQFAWDLYSQMSSAKPRENVFFSPASVAIALGMTYLGARDNTAMEMMKVYNSRRARVRFWLWITKVPGPTKTLHILNAEVVLITVWGGSISITVGNLWAVIDIPCYFHENHYFLS